MPRKAQKTLKPFFDVGYKVQLKPRDYPGTYFDGLHAIIKRIELRPDPEFLDMDEDEWRRSPHQKLFWVEIDHPQSSGETPFQYRDLQPLPPRMNTQQLATYCEQHMRTERNEDRWKAYLQVVRYLNEEKPDYPLTFAFFLPPGHCVDLINLFITWTAKMRQTAREVRASSPTLSDTYEAQAQVYDELCQLLIPKKPTLA